MPLKNSLLVWAFMLAFGPLNAQTVMKDPAAAFTRAKRSGHNILLIFSGTDWCVSCIRFEKTILKDSAFCQLARKQFVVLKADFPQNAPIPDTLRAQYEALAERFNPDGVFPRIVLLNPDQRFLTEIVYADRPVADFMEQLRQRLKK